MKFLPYVWLVIKSGFKSRAGYDGARTVDESVWVLKNGLGNFLPTFTRCFGAFWTYLTNYHNQIHSLLHMPIIYIVKLVYLPKNLKLCVNAPNLKYFKVDLQRSRCVRGGLCAPIRNSRFQRKEQKEK